MATLKGRILYEREFPSGEVLQITGVKDLDWHFKIAKNFELYELANTQTTDEIKFIYNNNVNIQTEMMQTLRDRLGQSIKVTSWYRTKEFNSRPGINGDPNSLHLKALATDCWFAKKDEKGKWQPMTDVLYKKIETLWKQICYEYGVIGGINRYTHGVHLSSREDMFGHKKFVTRDYRGKKGDW